MNELTEQDMAVIMYALQVYKAHKEWWEGHEMRINEVIAKVQDIQNKY
jgi:hypothetical protein